MTYCCGTSRNNSYECNYFTQRLQCNNCGRKGHNALVCCQPRQRRRGRSTFQPRGSAHTQRGTLNSFQHRRFFKYIYHLSSAWILRFAAISLYRRFRVNFIGSHNTRFSERSPHTVYRRNQRHTYQ